MRIPIRLWLRVYQCGERENLASSRSPVRQSLSSYWRSTVIPFVAFISITDETRSGDGSGVRLRIVGTPTRGQQQSGKNCYDGFAYAHGVVLCLLLDGARCGLTGDGRFDERFRSTRRSPCRPRRSPPCRRCLACAAQRDRRADARWRPPHRARRRHARESRA